MISNNFPPKLKAIIDFKFASELLVKNGLIDVNSWRRAMKLEATANFLKNYFQPIPALYFGEQKS